VQVVSTTQILLYLKFILIKYFKMVSGANNVSFTMDVSSSSVNNTYLLSLTAHWIDGGFVKVFAVLHAQPL